MGTPPGDAWSSIDSAASGRHMGDAAFISGVERSLLSSCGRSGIVPKCGVAAAPADSGKPSGGDCVGLEEPRSTKRNRLPMTVVSNALRALPTLGGELAQGCGEPGQGCGEATQEGGDWGVRALDRAQQRSEKPCWICWANTGCTLLVLLLAKINRVGGAPGVGGASGGRGVGGAGGNMIEPEGDSSSRGVLSAISMLLCISAINMMMIASNAGGDAKNSSFGFFSFTDSLHCV